MKKINCELTDEEWDLFVHIMAHPVFPEEESKDIEWIRYCDLSNKLNR